MKVKIERIDHYTKDRNDKPLITRNNKPYIRCMIKTEKGTISGFGSEATKLWKVGDEVDLEITTKEVNGTTYQNFKIPDQRVTRAEFDLLKQEVKFIKDELQYFHNHIDLKKKVEEIEEVDLGEPPDDVGIGGDVEAI